MLRPTALLHLLAWLALAPFLACSRGALISPGRAPARDARARLQADLERAEKNYRRDPASEENVIWLGRRLGYLGRYEEAVGVYTKGLEEHPDSFRILRHRGHRFITLRRFGEAAADLQRAAGLIAGVPDEIEPDGAPNRFNVPRSTTHFNIWYHLGLAHYLQGRLEEAARAYRQCLRLPYFNDDMLVATSHWLYMTLRRLGREQEARAVLDPIRSGMEILEDAAYHRLTLMYRGDLDSGSLLDPRPADLLEFSTLAYGVGNWHLCNGDAARAKRIFEAVIEAGERASFAYIAAEADLRRLSEAGPPRRAPGVAPVD